jgi:hypothetical protein
VAAHAESTVLNPDPKVGGRIFKQGINPALGHFVGEGRTVLIDKAGTRLVIQEDSVVGCIDKESRVTAQEKQVYIGLHYPGIGTNLPGERSEFHRPGVKDSQIAYSGHPQRGIRHNTTVIDLERAGNGFLYFKSSGVYTAYPFEFRAP